MSLGGLIAEIRDDRVDVRHVGIRTNKDGLRRALAEYSWRAQQEPTRIPPILVRAAPDANMGHIVLDGALRVVAARQAKLRTIAAEYVHVDDPAGLVFLGLRHGLPLTTHERNTLVQALALRAHTRGERTRLMRRIHAVTGLATATIATIVKGYTPHRTSVDRLATMRAYWAQEPIASLAQRAGITRQALYKDVRIFNRMKGHLDNVQRLVEAAVPLLDAAINLLVAGDRNGAMSKMQQVDLLLSELASRERSASSNTLQSQVTALLTLPVRTQILTFLMNDTEEPDSPDRFTLTHVDTPTPEEKRIVMKAARVAGVGAAHQVAANPAIW